MTLSAEMIQAIDEIVSSHGEDADGNVQSSIEEGWDSWWRDEPIVFTVKGQEISAERVSSFGGEGQGDDLWIVIKIGDQFFKKSGYYNSWDGGAYDGELFEVEPVQVTRTEYQRKG